MRDNRDFRIDIMKDAQEKEYAHSFIELFYVVSGTCRITVRDYHSDMEQGDIILVNAMEPHSYKSEGILCIIKISYRTFLRFAPDGGCIFFLNTTQIKEGEHDAIRHLIHELIWLETDRKTVRECRIYRDFYELMDILLLHNRKNYSGNASDRRHMTEDRKLQQIIAYVHGNYRETVSLSHLAKDMYASTSTLSRFFRKQTGIYFTDYVNQVRLAYAAGEMRYTGNSITKVASDCGFSSASSFAGLFHDYYGMSPNEYRKKLLEEQGNETEEDRILKEELAAQFAPADKAHSPAGTDYEISVDTSRTTRCHQPFRRIMTVGSMSALTRANVQYHLVYASRELHITHVRIWSIFTEDLRVTDGSTIGLYNYNAIDTVLDMLVENHIGVYFDFGRRPEMAVRTQDRSVYHEETSVRFTSRRAWEALLEDFVRHLISRYGADEVRGWYFDFNQDPSYKGTCAYSDDPKHTFEDVWRHAWRTIRYYIPGARVGGPVGLPNSPRDELSAFLKAALRDGCVPDFLSVVLFPYEPTPDYQSFSRSPDPDFEEHMLRKIKAELATLGLENLPIHVSDWNLSLSTRNYINDSCFRGAYLASRAGLMMQNTEICSMWVLSDWVSSYFDSRHVLNGGGGLLSRDSIRKPAWFALQCMSRLGQSLLYSDSHLVVTMRTPDDYMILAVNSTPFDVSYYLTSEDEIQPDDVENCVMKGETLNLRVNLNGMANGGEYIIKTRSISRQHGSILDEWKRLRCESQLERADIKYLQGVCVPHMSMERKTAQGDRLTIPIRLEAQEFCLFHIYRSS